MKNVINYYYNLYPENVFQNKDGYYFYIEGIRYCLIKYIGNLNEIDSIYETHLDILRRGLYVHLIVLNHDGKPLTKINNNYYILLQTKYYEEKISLNNLIDFSEIFISRKKCDWSKLWSDKNDYLEYQINLLGYKHPLLRDSFSYYLGLGEAAIAIANNIEDSLPLNVYCHKKISKKDTSFLLYNPLNIKVDLKVRDAAEYFKRSFFDGFDIEKELTSFFNSVKFSTYEYMMFFARMIYPTYYFDMYEEIITGRIKDENILPIINKASEYEIYLKKIYNYYKSFLNIYPIEWLN